MIMFVHIYNTYIKLFQFFFQLQNTRLEQPPSFPKIVLFDLMYIYI